MEKKIASYHLAIDNFVGPLDLLLELIEKNNLDINRIALSQLADQYLVYIDENKPGLRAIASFVEIASKLALIKSLTLLPISQIIPEEEREAADFEERVAIYSLFREAAKNISKIYRKRPLYAREVIMRLTPLEEKERKVRLECHECRDIYINIIKRLPVTAKLPEEKIIEKKKIEELIEEVRVKLEKLKEASFFEMVNRLDKQGVSSMLLAFLEIAKRTETTIYQEEVFGDIMMYQEQSN